MFNLYLRSVFNDFFVNIFLGILELEGQDAENICNCLLGFLNKTTSLISQETLR